MSQCTGSQVDLLSGKLLTWLFITADVQPAQVVKLTLRAGDGPLDHALADITDECMNNWGGGWFWNVHFLAEA